MAVKECAVHGCSKDAAFSTRTRPAWCDDHITEILRQGGLEPLEPFPGPKRYRLTRCLKCGCEAHYRFEYTLEKNQIGEKTCRACYWRMWASSSRRFTKMWEKSQVISQDTIRAHAADNGYEYVKPLTTPSIGADPHLVRCLYCQRLSAKRPADIGWGCTCQVNQRRSTSAKAKEYLKDSDLVAAAAWDHERNPKASWENVTIRATRKAWWRCPSCGESHEARVIDAVRSVNCANCAKAAADKAQEELKALKRLTVLDLPTLVADWYDEANPATVYLGEYKSRRFRCQAGHFPRVSPLTYYQSGCSVCHGLATRKKNLEQAERADSKARLNPEIAEQWHPTKNGSLVLNAISPDSKRLIWWREESCGHEWQARPADREKRQRLRCPECRTILDSLAYHFPEIAAEWSDSNPLTAWQVRPQATLGFEPEWQCSTEPNHKWRSSVIGRTTGTGYCPMCREHGKSWVELEHYKAAKHYFAFVLSGEPVSSEKFESRKSWYPDITVTLDSGRQLFIEYDGAYWHSDKSETDVRKTRDLLATGGLVVRLRESPLPKLPLIDKSLLQIEVHASAMEPDRTLSLIYDWAVRQDEN